MRSQAVLALLRRYESRNVTYIDPDGSWPIVWARARGTAVWDAEGRKYLDLTAAFGVAAAGHANPRVVRAGQKQMATLTHAMGDVHPHARKAELARELSRLTFERWGRSHGRRTRPGAGAASKEAGLGHGKTIFCNSGFEAVEAALKTAMLATGSPGIIAFRRGYHGLGYGALNATSRNHFRAPFLPQLGGFARFEDFPEFEADLENLETALRRCLVREPIGAVLVEPVQTRGGINVPPPGFLPMLRRVCDARGVLLILDEIYTGFGRTGKWFACEHWKVAPDLICLGKALTGGFPLSACVGRADVMDKAWPPSDGEAIHTSTFLGNPVGCAMALAHLREIAERRLPDRALALGRKLMQSLAELPSPEGAELAVRGLGLLVGVEIRFTDGNPATSMVLDLVKSMLAKGFLLLPEGDCANTLSFTPPLSITEPELNRAVRVLKSLLKLSRTRTQAPKATTRRGAIR